MKASFEDLPEETIAPAGVNLPKPSSAYLTEYAQGLGDGTRSLIGIPTGFRKLDSLTLGLDGLTILAGIPGKGKTSLALQMAFNACDAGAPVLFYSLEMPRRAIYTKILSRLAQVSYTDLMLKGRPYLADAQDAETAEQAIESKPGAIRAAMARLEAIAGRFYVIDKTDGELNAKTLEAQIAWTKAEHRAERVLVVIDHLQIFPTGHRDFSGIKDRIDYLVAALEGVKDRTGAAVLVISQKNRQGYYGRGLETLMGSAQIEYTADTVLLLDSKQEQKARANRQSQSKNELSELDELMDYAGPIETIELMIPKQRYNAPGKLSLSFDGRYSKFSEREP